MEQDLSFDEWFDIFLDKTKQLGYHGPVDKYTFEFDYETGVTPEKSATDFVKEMSE